MGYPSVNKSYMQTKYNVTPCANRRNNGGVKYIVVHYTGTDASAKNNCIYFGGGDRQASADYFIDKDGSIYKFNGNCACYYSWHCGDGYGKYGITNANSIGIEVVSSGAEYTQKQKDSLRKLVRAIMDDYGVKASNVVRHYDASRKICPKPYCGSTAKDRKWKELKSYITGGSASSGGSSQSGGSSASKPAQAGKKLGKVDVTYELNKYGGGWLGAVKNFNNKNSEGFAGIPYAKHDLFRAKVSKGSIKYRCHDCKSGKWTGWKKDWQSCEVASYIDGIQVYYTTPDGYEYQQAWYRSQTTERAGWLAVCCDDGNSVAGYDGWCGMYGEPLDRIQIAISDSNPFA